MGKTKIIFTVAALSAAIITGGSAIAFAEGTTDDAVVYSYTTGQQKHAERYSKFAEDVTLSDYGYANGKQRHTVSKYDGKSIEEQLANGTITQEEADIIKAEAHSKHVEIHARYAE